MSGFSFGGSSSGFSFGTPTAPATLAPAASSQPATGGFAFGGSTPAVGAPATTTATGGFSFGAVATPATDSKPLGFGGAEVPKPAISFGSQPASGGFSFASTSAPAAASEAPKLPLFGAATTQPAAGGFGFGAPATTTTAPATGFTLGAPAPSLGISPATTAASTGFSLGAPAANTASTGFAFGAPATTTTAPATGFSLGTPATSAPATAFTLGTPAATTSASTGFAFGAPTASTNPPSTGFSLATTTSAPAPGLAFGASPLKLGDLTTKPLATTTVPTLTTTPLATANASTVATSVIKPAGGPAVLRTKTVEEILNKWTTELDVWTREFQKMGVKVADWDNRILNGFGRISALYNDLQRTESLQQQIDSSLDDVEAQQTELSAILDDYERMVREVAEKELVGPATGTLSGLTKSKNPADIERESIYALSVSLSTSLSNMSQTLGAIISDVNAYAAPGTEEGGDPIKEISAVLDSHLTSLQWIDRATNDLQKDIANIRKTREVVESSARLV